MAKASGSYQAVIRGVSQQTPQDRRPGQHYEQVNMLSDPVRGLCRRWGSVTQDYQGLDLYTEASRGPTLEDTKSYKQLPFFQGSDEYDLVYRAYARPDGSAAPFAFCYDKGRRKYLPVVMGESALATLLAANGASAVVNVGRFLFFAVRGHNTSFSSVDAWRSMENYAAIWIRGGAYSRTYRVTVTLRQPDGTLVNQSVSYTTPPSAYQGVLDTSDIPATAEDYQKQVNDRTNAYNSAVTAWIGTAAAAIQPQAIAQELLVRLRDEHGWPESTAIQRRGSSVLLNASARPGGYTLVDIAVDDGGDSSLAKGVGNTVSGVEELSPLHVVGKVVRVKPKRAGEEDAFYMRAEASTPGTSGFTEVRWVEAAGIETHPEDVLCFGTVQNETLYIGGSAEELEDISGVVTPTYSPSSVGDVVTSPVPFFFGRPITYLGLLQDRLIVASGATIFASRPGDYLNWFRKTVLEVLDDDPFEKFALGSEGDTIVASTSFDRSLVLFGVRQQYIINGRNILTPETATIVPMSAFEDAVDAHPVTNGNFVFYSKVRLSGHASLHQIQTGAIQDAPESYEVSQQLDTYLQGKPVQIVAVTSPNVVMLRTEDVRNGFYLYTYLDSADSTQRLFDSWSRWEWNPAGGSIVGLSTDSGDVLVHMIRHGVDANGDERWGIGCERFVFTTTLSSTPYLDFQRPYTDFLQASGQEWLHPLSPAVQDAAVAFDDTVDEYLIGQPYVGFEPLEAQYPGKESAMWIGLNYDAYVTPTNPYVRDQNDRVIVVGRLTIVRYMVSVADTGGLTAYIDKLNNPRKRITNFTGRVLNTSGAAVGRQALATRAIPVVIGGEAREFTYTLQAQKWLPLRITAIEWIGQYFFNGRRL